MVFFPAQDLLMTVRVWMWKTPHRCASTSLTASCSASTLLIVFLGLFGLCRKLFSKSPLLLKLLLPAGIRLKVLKSVELFLICTCHFSGIWTELCLFPSLLPCGTVLELGLRSQAIGRKFILFPNYYAGTREIIFPFMHCQLICKWADKYLYRDLNYAGSAFSVLCKWIVHGLQSAGCCANEGRFA